MFRHFLFISLFFPSIGFSLDCSTSRCYRNAYDNVDPSSVPQLDRIKDIYDTLGRTIGSTKAIHSQLLIIESDGYPWAMALSDNTVVLTTGSIEKIYADNDLSLGDARAAFILGHELSHLETDDLFHHRAFVANKKDRNITSRPEEEHRADLRGYTYASIAGYDTHRLLEDGDDFFTGWLTQITKDESPAHPSNTDRLQYLTETYNNIKSDVPYYNHATALSHFGHYHDAKLLFENFLNHAETKEAYNNLGYIHIQLAREKMPVNMAYKFWFPTLLEPSSGLNIQRERSIFDSELPDEALDHLEDAERYLKYAINMDENTLSAHINLAVVYLYMPDKVHRAYASIKDAMQTNLGQHPAIRDQLTSMYQITRIQDDIDDVDRWPHARDNMQALLRDENVAENLLYNFARILDDRGRDNTAEQYWKRLYDLKDYLPAAYRSQVCFRLGYKTCDKTVKSESPWTDIPLPLSMDTSVPETHKDILSNWSHDNPPPKYLPELKAEIFSNSEGDTILALDNYMEMMILRNIPKQYQTLTDLQAFFGAPLVAMPLADGHLLSFDDQWSAVIKNNKVKEVWISKLSITKPQK